MPSNIFDYQLNRIGGVKIICSLFIKRGGDKVNKVILTIILFALAIALVIGVIIPVMTTSKSSGQEAKDKLDETKTNIGTLGTPVTYEAAGIQIITEI